MENIGGSLLLLAMGLGTVLLSCAVFFSRIKAIHRKEIACGVQVPAEIVRIETAAFGRKNRRTRYPVYEYEYGGRVWTVRAYDGIRSRFYRAGSRTVIDIDPDAPQSFFDPKYERARYSSDFAACVLFFIVGAGLIALSLTLIL